MAISYDGDYLTNSEQYANDVLSSDSGIGRARVVYFVHNIISMVLKHYYRGGAVAALFKN